MKSRKKYFLEVKTKKTIRKFVFKASVDKISLDEFIERVAKKFGYTIYQ